MGKQKYMDRPLIVALLFLATAAQAEEAIGRALTITPRDIARYEKHNITLMGAINISSMTTAGDKLMEFSGLAWDVDENLLYALSDRGYVVHLRPVFKDGNLSNLTLVAYHELLDENGNALSYKHADSEGLELSRANNQIKGDSELVVSFERIPRLLRFRTNGELIDSIPLPQQLADINHYAGENKSLEAVSWHPDYEFLLGAERPLPATGLSIFSSKIDNSLLWTFQADNKTYGSLVGMTTLPSGQLVLLERSFPGVFAGVTITLHLAQLEQQGLKQKKLAALYPGNQLFNDNFEAIAWHRSNRFFLISDDNDNLLQRSILLYIAVNNLDQTISDID